MVEVTDGVLVEYCYHVWMLVSILAKCYFWWWNVYICVGSSCLPDDTTDGTSVAYCVIGRQYVTSVVGIPPNGNNILVSPTNTIPSTKYVAHTLSASPFLVNKQSYGYLHQIIHYSKDSNTVYTKVRQSHIRLTIIRQYTYNKIKFDHQRNN